jgi:hypothetical protein
MAIPNVETTSHPHHVLVEFKFIATYDLPSPSSFASTMSNCVISILLFIFSNLYGTGTVVLCLCSHWLRMWNPSEVCIVCSSAIEALTDGSGHSVASLIMIVSGWPDIPVLTARVPNYVISSFHFNQLLTAEQQELFCMKVSIISVSLILHIAMLQI